MNPYNFLQRYILLLFIGCFILSGFDKNTPKASEPNELADNTPFIKFADAIQKKEKCSNVLKELCDTANVGVIHTFTHCKAIGRVKRVEESQQPPEIARARILLKGLSDIALKAIHDEFDAEERLAILQQLTRLEELLLKERPVGMGNVTVANSVSLLISGLIFQAVAESDISDLHKLVPFTQRRILSKYYTKEMLEQLLKREFGYSPATEAESIYDLLMNMIREKHTALVEKYKDRKVIDLLAELSLWSLSDKSKKHKSLNPLVETNPESFIPEFLIVRAVEICARISPIYRQLHEKYRLSKNREEFISGSIETFIANMTPFEKKILGNVATERAMREMALDVCGRVGDNLNNKGKEILSRVYGRYLLLSENLDIGKEPHEFKEKVIDDIK